MTLVKEQIAFMADVAKLINKALELGIYITGGELYRTKEQQELHVKNGRSKTMRSKHLKRLAIDFNFFLLKGQRFYYIRGKKVKPIIQPLGDYWESLNPKNKWGGNWKTFIDCPHFQRCI